MPPRKAPASSAHPKKKKRKTSNSPPFRFLGLPAELRNEIYRLVCVEQTKAFLSARTRSNLVSTPPLAILATSRQLRTECLPIFSFTAKEITARTKDLDFGPIITFFNRCADTDLKTLASTQRALDDQDRKMTVEIVLTENSHYYVDRLQRWINRFARPAKKGTDVRVEYRLVSESVPEMHRLRQIVRNMQHHYADPRQVDELKRMTAAVLRATTAWCRQNPYATFLLGDRWCESAEYLILFSN